MLQKKIKQKFAKYKLSYPLKKKDLAKIIKKYIDQCAWTITPLSLNPTSPGQGALACEVRKEDINSRKLIESINVLDDYECAQKERRVLESYGGGCHQKIGVSFFNTHFGLMHASKGEIENMWVDNGNGRGEYRCQITLETRTGDNPGPVPSPGPSSNNEDGEEITVSWRVVGVEVSVTPVVEVSIS